MSPITEVVFDKHIFGGDTKGVMQDGRIVFTPFVLPGEKANVSPYFEKKGYLKAELTSITQKSPDRIDPVCKYFGICGGCHYQILSYPNQLRVKSALVADQLERIAGIKNYPIHEIIASDHPLNYRNNLQFQVSPDGKLGFFNHNGKNVIPVDECHLPLSGILRLWEQLNLEIFPGLKRVQFREGSDGDQMIILESTDIKNLPEMEMDLALSVVHLSPAGPIVLAGDDHLVFEISQKLFKVSTNSFFQVNSSQAEKLVSQVLEFIPASGTKFLELYSGVGLFTAFIAPRFEQITAIEESESACEDFAVNLDAYDHISLYVGAMNDILPGIKDDFDCVLLDPPRSGIDEWSLKALLDLHIPKIVYVSCDVATLARDIKKFVSAGYNLKAVVPIDMFPQTYHVETVVLLEKQDTQVR